MSEKVSENLTIYEHFRQHYTEADKDGCWLWEGSRLNVGYGRFWCLSRVFWAHRIAYEYYKGPIPEGLHIDHLCRTRACVNPDHLEAVTPRENILRGTAPAAINARKTHCKRGHCLEGGNLCPTKNGSRDCRTCRNEQRRIRRRRKREQRP